MKVSRQFKEDFDLVMRRAGCTEGEIELAKESARRDYPAAQATFAHSAQLIKEGWDPLREHLDEFYARTVRT